MSPVARGNEGDGLMADGETERQDAGAGPDPYAAIFGDSGNDCDEAIHQLYHYLDGELTEDKRVKIAQHLDFCDHCNGAAAFESELRVVIASHCRDRVPESLMFENRRQHR